MTEKFATAHPLAVDHVTYVMSMIDLEFMQRTPNPKYALQTDLIKQLGALCRLNTSAPDWLTNNGLGKAVHTNIGANRMFDIKKQAPFLLGSDSVSVAQFLVSGTTSVCFSILK